jgi:hypothetical protein
MPQEPENPAPLTAEGPGMPGWVTWLLVGLALLVAVVVLVMVLTGGQHGPGMHGGGQFG